MESKAICRKCLLEDMDEKAVLGKIKELIDGIDEKDRTEEEVYLRRLGICRQCDSLISGTCVKCGCYVELRAASKLQKCPEKKDKWGL